MSVYDCCWFQYSTGQIVEKKPSFTLTEFQVSILYLEMFFKTRSLIIL